MTGGEKITSRMTMQLEQIGGAYPNRAVTTGLKDNSCKLPDGEGADNIIGVIQGVKDNVSLIPNGSDVEVIDRDMVYMESVDEDGSKYGDPVMVADAYGRVKTAVHLTPEPTNIIGHFWETTEDAGLVLVNLKKNGIVRTV